MYARDCVLWAVHLLKYTGVYLTFSSNPGNAITSAKVIVSYFFSKLWSRNIDFSGNSWKKNVVQEEKEMKRVSLFENIMNQHRICDTITNLHNWMKEEFQVDNGLVEPLGKVDFSVITY